MRVASLERHYQGALRELSDCPIRSAARVWVTTVSGTVTPNCVAFVPVKRLRMIIY